MKDFKNKHFKKVITDTTVVRIKPCRSCGESSEEWVKGILKNRKSVGHYSYPDLKKRSVNMCSTCTEKRKVSKIKKKEYSPIYFLECEICNTLFVTGNNRTKYCSKKCVNKAGNMVKYKKFKLNCKACGKNFTHNRKKGYCSKECESTRNHRPKELKPCKACGKEFSGKGNKHYCSKQCSSKPKMKPCPKCKKAEVSYHIKECESCKIERIEARKERARLNKEAKKKPLQPIQKTCPTCNQEFTTLYDHQIYCKKNHSPSRIEAKALRKRVKRKAKLSVESWNDIAKFKLNRPSDNHHLDHIIPLNHEDVCGLHNTWNFQWLTPENNVRKSNKFDGTMENSSWEDEN